MKTSLAVIVVVVAVPALAAVPTARGRSIFVHAWTPFDPESHGGDGVGPTYNASSCVECHDQGGPGGAGAQNVDSVNGHVHHVHGALFALPRSSLTVARAFPAFNARDPDQVSSVEVLSTSASSKKDRALIVAAVAAHRLTLGRCVEGAALGIALDRAESARISFTVDADRAHDVHVLDATIMTSSVPACFAAAVRDIHLGRADAPSIDVEVEIKRIKIVIEKPHAVAVVTTRNTPALFGDGLIESIPDEVIEAAASTSIAHHPEIRGVVGRTPEGRVARFGWKDDTPDLFTFVSRACSNELGLEVPGVPQPGKRSPGYDLDLDDVTALTSFVRSLPRPIEAERAPFASEGAELFDSIGCTACHRASLGDVDGIFSDLLLHDMGSMLDDVSNAGSYGGAPSTATSRMWRTPPLWGVRDSGPWLHDGRAKTLREAIEVHFGEASRVREQFDWLNEDQRGSIIAFLESLQAPTSTANAAE